MKGQIDIAIVFPGFNDLGRSVTPIFLLMDKFFYQFCTLSEKNEENHGLEILVFAKCSIELRYKILALCLSVRQFQMSLERTLLKPATENGEPGTGLWVRVCSDNPPENSNFSTSFVH